MLNTMIRIAGFVFMLMLSFGCDFAKSERYKGPPTTNSGISPASTPGTLKLEPLNEAADALCLRLKEIRKIPYKNPNDTDPILEALVSKTDASIPCLIERITDETPMEDPREAPPWDNYVVGDTAVFVLARIEARKDANREGEILVEMLPRQYQEEWKTNGVYAYFNYVSETKNRKALQRWWSERAKRDNQIVNENTPLP